MSSANLRIALFRVIPGRPGLRRLLKSHFLRDEPPVPSHEGIWGNQSVEFQKRFAPHGVRFPRKKRALSVR